MDHPRAIRRATSLLCGVLLGVGGGFVGYEAARLSGLNLYLFIGGVIGLAVAAIAGHDRSVRLTDITMSVPQVGELHFVVTRDSQQVAWKLFVELVTRISTQPLGGGGRIRSALTSLYGLLAFTRDLLKQNPPSRQTGRDPTVEYLAVTMLNNELRPFLTHWHLALREWEATHPGEPEFGWPGNEACRADLLDLQHRLQQYAMGFARLAGVPEAYRMVDGTLGAGPFGPAGSPTI